MGKNGRPYSSERVKIWSVPLKYDTQEWIVGENQGGCSTPGLYADCCEAWEYKLDNEDFDGDQINILFILDKRMADMVQTFAPWTNVFELTKPFKMSKNVFVSDPQVSCYSNYLRQARENRLEKKIKVNTWV